MEYISIDKVNKAYLNKTQAVKSLSACLREIEKIRSDSSLDDPKKMWSIVTELNRLGDLLFQSDYELLKEIRGIGNRYADAVKYVSSYRKGLMQGGDELYSSLNSLVQAQAVFASEAKRIYSLHEFIIDGPTSYNKTVVQALNMVISYDNQKIEQIKKESLKFLGNSPIELRVLDPLVHVESLPTQICVARQRSNRKPVQVLQAAGIDSVYEDIVIDTYNQGNVIVNVDYTEMSDKAIDHFVMAYIFRYFESFPLGSAHVHIIDDNTDYLYKRLYNNFQAEDNGDIVKDIIHIHTSLKDLEDFRDVICEDIFRKTSVDTPDLFSIYEKDKTDSFNLIVLRDGLVDQSGYVASETLDIVNSLTKPDGIGHKCGLRFLIIDSSGSFEKNLNDSNKHILSMIYDNCELKFSYSKSVFSLRGYDANVVKILDDIDVYVQERSEIITKAINRKEKNLVSIDDISTESIENDIGNIMYIPVGMAGGKTVELPFSCKDVDGTVAGQCIGYMAIGQSGSGKSSFFHSLVLNGCSKYSPKTLQFWLLDFKNGGASSKYSMSGIPHIRIIAENNKIDDALCLFQMVLEEMERRNKMFNKCFTDNIVEYNLKAKKDNLEYLPRIIIAIDEVQEIFRDDNASEIQKLISSISTRMRSSGMHFVMVAQNLCDGKAYMLKDAFLPSATGRICFRVAQDIPRDSGFGEEFVNRRQEIAGLKTGEAYLSYGKDSIKKVKMAFVSTQDMSDRCFPDIRKLHSEYSDMRPLVIGSKKRLSVIDQIQGGTDSYFDMINDIQICDNSSNAIVGEDVYRMDPLNIQFTTNENASVLLLGSDKLVASSLCASVLLSLMRQNVKVHVFNGDRTKIMYDNEQVQHPFTYVCQGIGNDNDKVLYHRMDQLSDVVSNLYTEYLNRQALVQKAEFDDPVFSPLFLIVNDLFGIESFVTNVIVESGNSAAHISENDSAGFNFNYDIFDNKSANSETGTFRDNIQNIMGILLKNGYRYNIFLVLSLKGDPNAWRGFRLSSEINNVILFNDTEYSDQVENSYFMKEMLKNIANVGDQETMAVWYRKKTFSKIRPIIYNVSAQNERELLDSLIRGNQT